MAGETPVEPMVSEAAVRKKIRAERAEAAACEEKRSAEAAFAEEAAGRRRSRRRVGLSAA